MMNNVCGLYKHKDSAFMCIIKELSLSFFLI